MPQDVVNRVHVLAQRSNANKALLFAWRNGSPITDDTHDEDNPDDDDYNSDDNSYGNNDDEYAYPFEADCQFPRDSAPHVPLTDRAPTINISILA
jgi:hypothetical protein